MKLRINKNIFFQKAFIFSLIAHGAGLYLFTLWVPSQNPLASETKPIQIKNIIFNPVSDPKKIKPLQPSTPIFNKYRRPLPTAPSPRQFKNSVAAVTLPVPIEDRTKENIDREPHPMAQPFKVAKLIALPQPKPSTFQVGLQLQNIRQPGSSPVRSIERISYNNNSLHKPTLVNLSQRFNSIPTPTSQLKIRSLPAQDNFKAISPIHKVESKIQKTPFRQIFPVRVASIPSSFTNTPQSGDQPATNTPEKGKTALDSPGKDLGYLRAGFSSDVRGKIAVAKYYPGLARKKGWEGKPVIEFQIGRNGELLDYSIAVSSSHEILDLAALDAVKKASPYPKIPKPLQTESIRFKLPISFKLSEP